MKKQKQNSPVSPHLFWIRAFLLVCLFGTAALIFALSAQPGQQSYELTNAVSGRLEQSGLQALTPGIGSYSLYVSVRKWGHIYLYGLLGGLAACFACTFLARSARAFFLRRVLAPAVFGFCYALSDEGHQSFIPGREAAWRDVGFDCIGIAAGVLIVAAAALLLRRRAAKRGAQAGSPTKQGARTDSADHSTPADRPAHALAFEPRDQQ